MIRNRNNNRNLLRAFVALAALCAFATLFSYPNHLCAQSEPVQKPTGNRVISGVLLNAKTGQPIEGATVTLAEAHQRQLTSEMETDAEGRFSFSNLPDGKYALRASHRGYIASAFEQHPPGMFTAILTGEGLNSTDLKFMLQPQCSIYGTVSEDSGDPVGQARVALFRVDAASGTGRMVRANSTISDGAGFYQISGLAPGSYYMAVTGTPWYATRRQSRDPMGNPIENLPRSPLDVAYPLTYYPDVIDANAASPITVNPGDRVQADLTLHPVPAIHIVYQAQPAGPNQGFSMPQVRQDVFGNSDYVPMAGTTMNRSDPRNPNSGITMELSGVAPGQYEVVLNGQNGQSGRSMSLDASSDRVNLDPSSAVPLVEVSGKAAMAGEGALPPDLTLDFTSKQTNEQLMAHTSPDGSFKLQPMQAGTYEVTANATGFSMDIMQLTATGATANGHLLKIGSEPVTVSAKVAESIASVNGLATLDGKPASGVLLVLVPARPTPGQEDSRINQSDSDGSFEFQRVIAGSYILVAIQDGWSLEWGRREAMAPYLAKGQSVLVPMHTKEVKLAEPVEVQPR